MDEKIKTNDEQLQKAAELMGISVEELMQMQALKEAQETEKRKSNEREAYRQLVDETIEAAAVELQDLSLKLCDVKAKVMEQFREAIRLKSELFQVKSGQRSHTFTNSNGTVRITLGHYVNDNYLDTVDEGIAMVNEYLDSMATDDKSRTLVGAVRRLMSRNLKGDLQASRVMQLSRMAQESGNERFIEAMRIINEAYAPSASKQFIRLDVRDDAEDAKGWRAVPLGLTEAGVEVKKTEEKDNGDASDLTAQPPLQSCLSADRCGEGEGVTDKEAEERLRDANASIDAGEPLAVRQNDN